MMVLQQKLSPFYVYSGYFSGIYCIYVKFPQVPKNNFVQHSGTWISGIFFVGSPPLYCMVSQHRFAANMEDVDQDICV